MQPSHQQGQHLGRPTSASLPHIYSASSSSSGAHATPLVHSAPSYPPMQHPQPQASTSQVRLQDQPDPSNKSQQHHRHGSSDDSVHSSSEAVTPEVTSLRSLSNATTVSEGTGTKDPDPPSQPLPALPPLLARSSSNATLAPSAKDTVGGTLPVRRTSGRYTLPDFVFVRVIGTGSFGHVHLVRSRHNARFYAMKVLQKDKIVRMKQVEHTNSERAMLERVRHPFLITLWGTFQCPANVYLVMDFVPGGELFSLLRRSQRFPDPVAKFFAAEVGLALDYLHSQQIIYRDLKPENLLLGLDGHIKLADFGFAKFTPDVTWTLCGTPDYLAPEIIQNRAYNKTVDWYALGVLIFEMLAGYPPFYCNDAAPMRLYEKILAGRVKYPPYFSLEAKDLLKRLLTSDLTKRFGNMVNGSRDIFSHPWFAEVDWERLYNKQIPAPWVPRASGPGDSSCFERYPDVDVSTYGMQGPDPYARFFADF